MIWAFALLLLAPGQPRPSDSADKRLEALIERSPKDARAWVLLAQARAESGNPAGALQAAARASEFAGRDAAVLYNLAVLYFRMGKFDHAIASGLRVREIENSAEAETLLAEAYDKRGDWASAKASYLAARKLDPYGEGPIFRFAQAYLKRMDFAGAVATLEEGRSTFDKSAQLELALGVAYYGQRRFTDALDRFLRVMELDPMVPQAYAFSGRLLEHAGERLPVLQARYATYQRLAPKDAMGFILEAKVLLEQDGNSHGSKAKELLAKALSLDSGRAEAHFLMGRVLEGEKDLAGALREYERSVELDPKDPAPHFRLARLYQRQGKPEVAARHRRAHEELSEEAGRQVALPGGTDKSRQVP